MHFSRVAIIFASIALVRARCYTSGEVMDEGQKNAAKGYIDQWCNAGGLSGTFNGGQWKGKCVQISNTQRINLEVKWTGGGGLPLNDADCKLRLSNEINGCDRGGESETAGWWFKADPANGIC